MRTHTALVFIGLFILTLIVLTSLTTPVAEELETPQQPLATDVGLVVSDHPPTTLSHFPRIPTAQSEEINRSSDDMTGTDAAFLVETVAPLLKSLAAAAETQADSPTDTVDDPLRQYGNDIAVPLLVQGSQEPLNSAVFNAFIANASGAEEAADLHAVGTQYDALLIQLEQIEVPALAQTLHNKLTSDYATLANAVRELSTQGSQDQLSESLNDYNKIATPVSLTLRELFFFFKEHNVQFQPTDPGFIFTLAP